MRWRCVQAGRSDSRSDCSAAAELKRAGKSPIAPERLVDTLVLARRKHADGHNTLDDLCARYRVDRSRRTQHGALLDAEQAAVERW
jgi:DNA polymerase III subunit epsilon